MPLPLACENKIRTLGESESIRQGLLDLFKAMVKESEIEEEQLGETFPHKSLAWLMYEDGDLEPGDWAAELHLVIRKVETVEQTTEAETERQALRPEDRPHQGR